MVLNSGKEGAETVENRNARGAQAGISQKGESGPSLGFLNAWSPPKAGIDQGAGRTSKGGLRSFEAATRDGRDAQEAAHSQTADKWLNAVKAQIPETLRIDRRRRN